MKKIMFNDDFGLTKAVLSRLKTQTRRIIPGSILDKVEKFGEEYYNSTFDRLSGIELLEQYFFVEKIGKLPYQVGEIVAIAQAYRDIWLHTGYMTEAEAMQCAGYSNKMFVRADLMPHNIQFTRVRIERLQDISDEDCLKEGVIRDIHRIPTKAPQYHISYYPCQYLKDCADKVGWGRVYDTPQKAYAELIDRVSRRGMWDSNPFTFAYDFELVK